jgi:hypothetical protein
MLACWVLVTAVAASRVFVGAHSRDEVLIGPSIGAGASLLFAVQYPRRPLPHTGVLLLTLSGTVVLLMRGMHLQAETFSRYIDLHGTLELLVSLVCNQLGTPYREGTATRAGDSAKRSPGGCEPVSE